VQLHDVTYIWGMESQRISLNNSQTVEASKLYTKSQYAKAYQISRPTIDRKIESKQIKTIEINGATLIVAK
jgi:hypothetical protein